MRSAHTLKSMAATMSFRKMSELCHVMEDGFETGRKHGLDLTEEMVELLFKSFDLLDDTVRKVVAGQPEPETDVMVADLKKLLESTEKVDNVQDAETPKLDEKEEVIDENIIDAFKLKQ
jgi:chemotaxis protein histidine kinase CheA